MTIGIYKLVFKGSDKVYIGQSTNIEKRFGQHISSIRNNSANAKLMMAYESFGLPNLEIILECTTDSLDENEDLAIEIYDSVNKGLNIYKYANEAPTYKGFGYANSKYTKQQLIETLKLLVQNSPVLTYKEIQEITNVSCATITKIVAKQQHSWLSEECCSLYTQLDSIKEKRKLTSNLAAGLSAKDRNINYPLIVDPKGNTYKVDNARQFALSHSLAPNHLTEVLNGHRKSHKGWHL